jgi:hypothetical protein
MEDCWRPSQIDLETTRMKPGRQFFDNPGLRLLTATLDSNYLSVNSRP